MTLPCFHLIAGPLTDDAWQVICNPFNMTEVIASQKVTPHRQKPLSGKMVLHCDSRLHLGQACPLAASVQSCCQAPQAAAHSLVLRAQEVYILCITALTSMACTGWVQSACL